MVELSFRRWRMVVISSRTIGPRIKPRWSLDKPSRWADPGAWRLPALKGWVERLEPNHASGWR